MAGRESGIMRTLWNGLSGPGVVLLALSWNAAQAEDSTGTAERPETAPPDDAVLERAPPRIGLEFPAAVRLVKLTLRNDRGDWVDIGFRYSPRPGRRFSQPVPALADAAHYTAEWAALSGGDRLARGSFSFAFGGGARKPSAARAAREELLLRRRGDPDVRHVAPARTRIIIDRKPPRYDPPFTIDLEAAPGPD